MAIERLGAEDVPRLRALNALFARAFEDDANYAGAPPDDDWLRATLARDHVIVLVSMAGDRLAGGLVAYELDKLEQARREIYLYDLAVDAPHRRQGHARALIGELRRIAKARGAWTVFVQADRGDAPAIALYESLGAREEVLHFDIAPV